MDHIFHIAAATDWEAAQRRGSYTQSTRGRTLEEEGFIHCSYRDQLDAVARYVYADLPPPLVLLTIDASRVAPPIKVEDGYPHIYGPLDAAAVIAVREFHVS